MKSILISLALTLTLGSAAIAQPLQTPRFAELINDHAVLQRDQPVHLWGYAAPASRLTLSIAGQTFATITDDTGRWQVMVPALKAGGPYEINISDAGGKGQSVKDVMIGEVWLCSGQSNMGFLTKNAANASNEIADSRNPALRFVDIARSAAPQPQDKPAKAANWKVAGPETIGDISAVCYYMSQALQKKLDVTIGFITSAWGGTQGQAWVSAPALRALKNYDAPLDTLDIYATDQNRGIAAQQKILDAWWAAHEPDAKAKARWATLNFDDSAWSDISASRVWERQGIAEFAGFNGAVWYRTSVTLTAEQAKSASRLGLGMIDDNDTAWVNGAFVGGMDGRTTKRVYNLPAGVLKAGRNVIAVRVLDSGGSGGLTGDGVDRYIALADGSKLPLPEKWKYKLSASLDTLGETPLVPWDPAKGVAVLYNGMIAPVTPYTIKGVAWYQGEANTRQAAEYARVLPALITDWRKAFNAPDLPFLIVQLPNYGPASDKPTTSRQQELREAQRQTALTIPNTGLIVTTDVGDRFDIHPAQKKVVGNRLALAAQRFAYGQSVTLSPAPQTITRGGNDIVIKFSDTAKGLVTYSSDVAIGFETCNATRDCRYAPAIASGDTVTLKGSNSPEVKYVRFAWSDAPFVNLFNSDDLPAVPFETPVP